MGQVSSVDFQGMWHRASVEAMTEADIEKYLDNVGLGMAILICVSGIRSSQIRTTCPLSRLMGQHEFQTIWSAVIVAIYPYSCNTFNNVN